MTVLRRLILAAILALAPSLALAQANSGAFYRSQNALSTTVATLKGSPGVLRTVNCGNANAAIAYLQFFDTVGAVTLGTTPPTFVLSLPASTSFSFPANLNFVSGLKVAAATTATGNSALGSALVCTFGVN